MSFKINTKYIITISSVISICLVLFIAINANRYIGQMWSNNAELYSAYRISELMKSFKANIAVMENKQRGYIVTGDTKFLETYKLKETETKTYLQQMEKYFLGKPEEIMFTNLKILTYKKLDEVKDLTTLNKNTKKKLGYNASENVGLTTMDEINTDVDNINNSLSKTTALLLNNSLEFVQVSKTYHYLMIIIAIIAALAAVIILFRDVNIRNKLENELRIAKKKADNNAIMKEQFMANMSHEIRTPMNAILGFSNLLSKTNLNEKQSQYLSAIGTSSSNLLNIINDILDFSKIEAGKLHIEIISFDIIQLLHSIEIMFKEKANEKQIHFEFIVDNKTPQFVFGDPTRLTQILVNLINNAIKFTNQGKVMVVCNVIELTNDISTMQFKITDTGIGIPIGKLETIFERFNQGNPETTRKYGGTGLGLAIVKNLIESQNGKITVISKEGKGSEFDFTLQFNIANELKYTEEKQTTQNHLEFSTKGINILLAEDNLLNQKLATTYLENHGLTCDVAENGMIALEKVKSKRYNIILMDIQMPLLDGHSTAKKIREELNLSIPIIAMTAHVLPDELEKCKQSGMNDYISKPFKESELLAVISKYLQHNSIVENNIESEMVNEGNISEEKERVVDLKELQDLARGDKLFMKEIIEVFFEQNKLDTDELINAIAIDDYSTIQSMAHKMKTSIGFLGMKQLLPLLENIENTAKIKGSIKQISDFFNELNKKLNRALIELKTVLNNLNEYQEIK